MEIDKQAKALLNGEVVEIRTISPIMITSMTAEMGREPVVMGNQMQYMPSKPTYRIEAEIQHGEHFSMEYGKNYYLVEVLEDEES